MRDRILVLILASHLQLVYPYSLPFASYVPDFISEKFNNIIHFEDEPLYSLDDVVSLKNDIFESLQSLFVSDYRQIIKYYEAANNYAARHVNNLQVEPAAHMTTLELVRSWGYPAEAHNVTTDDGYILEIHRIPYGKGSNATTPGPPVYLQHGLLSSSADWVINLPNQSLAYMLADAGYDVWMGNARGNFYSRRHVNLDPKKAEFWQFSWDEMGQYDVPATIDHILVTTSEKQLYYVGHSMGTTMAFAMLSTKVEYNDKIKTFFAMGPVTLLNHMKCKPLLLLIRFQKQLMKLLKLVGIHEFLSNNDYIKLFAGTACNSPARSICVDIVSQIFGRDDKELNMTRLPIYFYHTPAGTSVQTVEHYGQIHEAQVFQHFDWGYFTNLRKYGTPFPPAYKLRNVKVPTLIFYGLNDILADPEDVNILASQLPKLIGKYQIGDQHWSHIDFLWGIDDGPLLNNKVISMMKMF